MDWLRPVWAFLVDHPYLVAFVGTVVDATGIPFPGRILLVLIGAGMSRLTDVAAVTLVGALGALVGDHLWYVIGRWGGKRALALYCRLSLASRRCVSSATDYYRRYGAAAIVIGRFVAGVRIFTAPLAGSGVIPYPKFLAFEVLGALLWSGLFVGIGYAFGTMGADLVERLGWASVVVMGLTAVGLAAAVAHRLWRRSRYGGATL